MFAAIWGVLLGFPVLRLRGDYLAIVTLGFGEIIRIILSTGRLHRRPERHLRHPEADASSACRSSRTANGVFHQFFGIEFNAMHRLVFLYYVILVLALHHELLHAAPAPAADRARLGGAARG